MPQRALEAAKDQLAYWQKEHEAARRAQDAARQAQCERFIAQCELMISVLTQVAARR
jgi:hypothetical protein